MPLQLPARDSVARWPDENQTAKGKGGRLAVQRSLFSNHKSLMFIVCLFATASTNIFLAASSYFGCGDDSHILASLATKHYGLDTDNPTLEEDQEFSTKTEADWLDDNHLVESVDRTQAKISDALALEVSSRQLF